MCIDINSRNYTFETFNPDCMELGDLRVLADYLAGNIADIGREWLPTYSPHEGQLIIIRFWLYCVCKIAAIERRLAGNVAHAMAYEEECETLYKLIPQGLRW